MRATSPISTARNRYTGQNYEERGRTFMAMRGQITRVIAGREGRGDRVGGGHDGARGIHQQRRLERVPPHRARQYAGAHPQRPRDVRGDRRRSASTASLEGLLGVQVHVGPADEGGVSELPAEAATLRSNVLSPRRQLPSARGPGKRHRGADPRRAGRRAASGAARRHGSGKTFTMAKVIEAIGRPALVLAHNKTLAAQLYHEFKSFFPDNAVEYFVSYYDYYQPEAYIPSSDVYIEKEATINDELDKLRLSATKSLFERRDCVIIASVSCIYGLGSPEAYYGMLLMLEKGQKISREADPRQAGRDPVRPQRRRLPPRHVPRARRRDRGLPDVRRLRLPHRAVGRRGRVSVPDRPAARTGEADLHAPADLSRRPTT